MLYFSDSPKRVVGHMSAADFADVWAIGDKSFRPASKGAAHGNPV